MFSFLKRKVSPTTLGVKLVELVDWTTLITAESLRMTLEKVAGEEVKKAVRLEFIPLRAFAVDFGITKVFGEGPVTRAVLDSFYTGFRAMLQRESVLFMFEFTADRGQDYAKVVRATDFNGLPTAIGNAFAQACGYPSSEEVVGAGMLVFVGTLKTITDGLNKVKIL